MRSSNRLSEGGPCVPVPVQPAHSLCTESAVGGHPNFSAAEKDGEILWLDCGLNAEVVAVSLTEMQTPYLFRSLGGTWSPKAS